MLQLLNQELSHILSLDYLKDSVIIERRESPWEDVVVFNFNKSVSANKIVKIFNYLENRYGSIITRLKLKNRNKLIFYVRMPI